MNNTHDVIIVGAGAAGLSCAQDLIQNGLKVLILEARSRIGGRVFTLHPAEHRTSIELGAEFNHGYSTEVVNVLQNVHLPFYDANDEHFYLKNRKLAHRPHFWEELQELMKCLPKNKNQRQRTDTTVKEFLKTRRFISPSLWLRRTF